MTTVWNSADKTSGITLSNADLTATNVTGANEGLRSTNPIAVNSGRKVYVEFTGITLANSNSHIGIASETWGIGTAPSGSNGAVVFGYGGSSSFGAGGDPSGYSLTGKTLCMALDMAARKIWWRENGGNWNNNGSANPATGVGANAWTDPETVISPHFFNYYLGGRFRQTGDKATINVGGTPFIYTPPTGFDPWDNTIPPSELDLVAEFFDDGGISRANITVGYPDLELAASFADDGGISKANLTVEGGSALNLSASFFDDTFIRAVLDGTQTAPVIQSIVIVTGR